MKYTNEIRKYTIEQTTDRETSYVRDCSCSTDWGVWVIWYCKEREEEKRKKYQYVLQKYTNF